MTLFLPLGSHLLFLFVHTTKQNLMFIAPGYKNMGGGEIAHKLYTNMTSSGTACSPTASFLFFYFLSNWIGGRGRVIEILVYSAMSFTLIRLCGPVNTNCYRTPFVCLHS